MKVKGYIVSLIGFSRGRHCLVRWLEAISQLPKSKYPVSFVIVLDPKDSLYPDAGPCTYIEDGEIVLGLPESGTRKEQEARHFLLHQVYHEIGHVLYGRSESKANAFADEQVGSPWPKS